MKLGKSLAYLADMAALARHIQIEVAKINSQIGWRYHQLLCHATVKFKPFTKVKYQQVLASVL
jgi:polysaccharide pyruvyl transferase WcaK-like protein